MLWWGKLLLRESTEDTVEHLSSQCFMVSIVGGVKKLVPMVMVADRRDTTGVPGFFKH
jgi:hypothetical protein